MPDNEHGTPPTVDMRIEIEADARVIKASDVADEKKDEIDG